MCADSDYHQMPSEEIDFIPSHIAARRIFFAFLAIRTPVRESDINRLLGHQSMRQPAFINSNGYTAVYFAAFFGKPTVLRLLLTHPAYRDVIYKKAEDNDGQFTPLQRAASMGHLECVQILCEHYTDDMLRKEKDTVFTTSKKVRKYFRKQIGKRLKTVKPHNKGRVKGTFRMLCERFNCRNLRYI